MADGTARFAQTATIWHPILPFLGGTHFHPDPGEVVAPGPPNSYPVGTAGGRLSHDARLNPSGSIGGERRYAHSATFSAGARSLAGTAHLVPSGTKRLAGSASFLGNGTRRLAHYSAIGFTILVRVAQTATPNVLRTDRFAGASDLKVNWKLAGIATLAYPGEARLAGVTVLEYLDGQRLAGNTRFEAVGASLLAQYTSLVYPGATRLSGMATLAWGLSSRISGTSTFIAQTPVRLAQLSTLDTYRTIRFASTTNLTYFGQERLANTATFTHLVLSRLAGTASLTRDGSARLASDQDLLGNYWIALASAVTLQPTGVGLFAGTATLVGDRFAGTALVEEHAGAVIASLSTLTLITNARIAGDSLLNKTRVARQAQIAQFGVGANFAGLVEFDKTLSDRLASDATINAMVVLRLAGGTTLSPTAVFAGTASLTSTRRLAGLSVLLATPKLSGIAQLEAASSPMLAGDALLSPTAVLAQIAEFAPGTKFAGTARLHLDSMACTATLTRISGEYIAQIAMLVGTNGNLMSQMASLEASVAPRLAGVTQLVIPGVDRFPGTASLTYYSGEILAGAVELEASIGMRLSQTANIAGIIELFSQTATLDANATTRTAGRATFNAPAQSRSSQIATPNAATSMRSAELSTLDKSTSMRVSSGSTLVEIVTTNLSFEFDGTDPGTDNAFWLERVVPNTQGAILRPNSAGRPVWDSANGGNYPLDGTTQYIEPRFPAAIGDSVTWSIWFKINSWPSIASPFLGKEITTDQRWDVTITSDRKLSALLRVYNDIGQNPAIIQTFNTTTTALQLGVWYNYTLTYCTSTATIPGRVGFYGYLNGVQEGNGAFYRGIYMDPDWQKAQTAYIGVPMPNGSSIYYDMDVAYFSGYVRGITAAEVLQNFNALRNRYGV